MKTNLLLVTIVLSACVTIGRAAEPVPNLWLSVIPAATETVSAPPPSARSLSRRQIRNFTELGTLHESYVSDFASKPGFGLARMPFLQPEDYFTDRGQTYHFAAPGLLGLEDSPVAYERRGGGPEILTMQEMSRKEARASLRRRPLTAAETQAVAALRAGKELVTMPLPAPGISGTGAPPSAPGMLVVGALRARAQCAQCHQVKEGTLLGAFSYVMTPATNNAIQLLTLRGADGARTELYHPSLAVRTPFARVQGVAPTTVKGLPILLNGVALNSPASRVLAGTLTNLLQPAHAVMTTWSAPSTTLLP